jgi:thiamine biosynthesis lipoprotein
MGTTYRVRLAPALDPVARAAVTTAIERELALVDQRMSAWRADSELTHFNEQRTTGPQRLSPEIFEVLVEAERVAALTDGAFDATVAPLFAAWGFGARASAAAPPDAAQLAALRARVGWHLLALDPIQGTAAKGHPDLALDLDGIAPGYAVDRIAAALEELGWTDYLVEIGGEVRARGRNEEGLPWRIGIERPESTPPGDPARVVSLDGMAAATSGDYRTFRVVDGRRLAHIIDPRTGEPIANTLASATVLAPLCITADALATALMVMGPDQALAFAEREGLAVLLQVREGQGFVERVSSNFPAEPE